MKGQPWTHGLKTVHAVQRDLPKPVTLVYPYYDNPGFLRRQMDGWFQYDEDVAAKLSLIVVDDGSPDHPAHTVVAKTRPFPIRIFRIDQDVRWNWLAARNIGFHHAPEGWVLVTDMDHVIPRETICRVVYGWHYPKVIYGFARQEQDGRLLPAHPNSWLMTRAMFWTVGGYDETLSGHYGTDGDWRRRCAAVAPIHILTDRLIRHEHEGDSSTVRYLRKQPQDAAVKRLIAMRGKNWRPKVLTFPYREVEVA